MSKTPNFDLKIKAILDATTPGERVCAATGETWIMDEKEISMYKKFNVPPSKFSPLTRQKLLNSYFVIFDIWYNRHAETGKPIISNIHPATGIRVLPDKEWFERDFTSHGETVDVTRPFLPQFYELSRAVPRAAGYHYVPPENSIAFISLGDQNSYFVLACKSKRCYYSINAHDAEDSAELSMVRSVQLSYNVIHSERIYRCRFVRVSYDCTHSDFLFDCRNCEFCFGATNKRNKKYFWWNEQLSKEEWEKRYSEVDLSSTKVRGEYEKKFHELVSEAVWPENFNLNVENSSGEYLNNVTNVKNGYFAMAKGSRDLEYVSYVIDPPSHDCFFCAAPMGSSDIYDSVGASQSFNVKFSCSVNVSVYDSEFCESSFDIKNCFGCIGLRKKQFCILNKQYSESEYWQILDDLKCAMLDREEYGDLPPASFSTQVCMGSGAGVLYGASEQDCTAIGARSIRPSDEGAEGPSIDTSSIHSIDEIPDTVRSDQFENIIGKPFKDEATSRRYTYLRQELELYEKLGVAPPRCHPTTRVLGFYKEMNMPIFEETACRKCQISISVAKNRAYPKRNIYCRSCYLQHLEQYG